MKVEIARKPFMTLVKLGERNIRKTIACRTKEEILQNHGEIQEQSLTLAETTRWQSCCFLCSELFWRGPTSAVASSLQVQGQAARPCEHCCCTPTRPAALFRAPELHKNFPEENFSRPEVILFYTVGWFLRSWAPFFVFDSAISRLASEEVRPSRNFTESFSSAVKAEKVSTERLSGSVNMILQKVDGEAVCETVKVFEKRPPVAVVAG